MLEQYEDETRAERVLKQLYGKPSAKRIYGFDLETYGNKNRFLMGSIYGEDIVRSFWNKDDMIDFIMKNRRLENTYIVATNLGFDFLNLFEKTEHLKDAEILIKSSNLIYAKFDKNHYNRLNFIDTMNFIPISVKRMGDLLELPKLKTPDWIGNKPKTYDERLYLERYNLRDSEITYRFTSLLQKGFNNLGAKMKITLASTSMDLFRRKYMKEDYFQPQKEYLEYLFKGYYGGRVEAVKRGLAKNLKYYDVNSLYPFVMQNEYPNPNHLKYSRNIKLKTIMQYEGVAKVKVIAPKMYIPYLPYRFGKYNYNKKLIFPTGEFIGHYTFFELRKALELGYKIIKLYDGIIYFKKFEPFKEYVNELYKNRLMHKSENNPLETVDKICMNSLYGKFAQKITEKESIIHESKMSFDMLKKYHYVNRTGNYFIVKEKDFRIPKFVNPIFSLYTTAYARDVLYNLISKVKQDKIYYYDTDSLMTSQYFETSKKLGALKLEDNIPEAIFVKPKMYYYTNGKDDRIKIKGARTGVKTKEQFYKLFDNQKVTLEKFTKFKESNKRNFEYNQRLVFEKLIGLEDNKRKWKGKFKPYELHDSKPLCML